MNDCAESSQSNLQTHQHTLMQIFKLFHSKKKEQNYRLCVGIQFVLRRNIHSSVVLPFFSCIFLCNCVTQIHAHGMREKENKKSGSSSNAENPLKLVQTEKKMLRN